MIIFTLNKVATFICFVLAVVYTYYAEKFATFLISEYNMNTETVVSVEIVFVISFWVCMIWTLYRVVSRKF